MKISLIIPAYNEEKFIGACLDHAIKNSHGIFHEIIVVDNASTDRTAEIAGQFPGVRVVHEPIKGLTRARQRGFEEATGELLAYNDADTQMPEGWTDMMLREFSGKKYITCLSGPYIYYDIPKFHQWLIKVVFWYLVALPGYWIIGYLVIGGNFVIRRDVVEKMGGFDTSITFYGEDTDIARRASQFGKAKFKYGFAMPTSGRRIAGQGMLTMMYVYVKNYLSEVFFKRPATSEYIDIR